MLNHVAGNIWNNTDVHSYEWAVSNIWMAVARWPVSVFFMISGALFLSRDITFRKIYGKYIFRMFTAFSFWSFLYTALFFDNGGNYVKSITHFLWGGGYHFWFLFTISGLYMIVPFMKRIAESESLTKYFLVLSLIFAFAIPEAAKVIALFSERGSLFFKNYTDKLELYFVLGASGYFLLGYALCRAYIAPRLEKAIYAAGILSFASTILFTSAASHLLGKASHIFCDNLTLNILLEAAAVFVFFRKYFDRPSEIIRKLSQYSFGAYLVHVAVIETGKNCGLNAVLFDPLFSVPVISVIVFVISFGISALLNQIPVVKKYIV